MTVSRIQYTHFINNNVFIVTTRNEPFSGRSGDRKSDLLSFFNLFFPARTNYRRNCFSCAKQCSTFRGGPPSAEIAIVVSLALPVAAPLAREQLSTVTKTVVIRSEVIVLPEELPSLVTELFVSFMEVLKLYGTPSTSPTPLKTNWMRTLIAPSEG